MKISVGANPFYWQKEQTLSFYEELSALPVDVVYLGEWVCSRRHEMRAKDYLDLAARLARAGKEVVLSSLSLIEGETDLMALRKLARQTEFKIEANEMGVVRMLSGPGLPWVAGGALNVYNGATLQFLRACGAMRWVVPVELGPVPCQKILSDSGANIETEILAYGQIPLALSARCFTARRFGKQKDQCEFKCQDHPEGIPLKTKEGDPFLVINGLQTLSYKNQNLMGEITTLRSVGVTHLRLTPQRSGMAALVSQVLDAVAGKAASHGPKDCNGFWHAQAGHMSIEECHS